MNETILAVDDEPRILSAYQRNLGEYFHILTAEGPQFALSMMKAEPFAVVLTDLKMPGMDGIELLRKARELQPHAARILISGHADMSDAISSINNAGVFRMLIKPCPIEDLSLAFEAGIEQHRLVTAEKDLLEQTLKGSIQMLTDILALQDPEAFGNAQRRSLMAKELAKALEAPEWLFDMTALLSEIGRATLPVMVKEKIAKRAVLTDIEQKLVDRVPEFSYDLLKRIPRLEEVAKAVLYQNKNYDGTGYPEDEVMGEEIPLAARAIHAINGAAHLCREGMAPDIAVTTMKAQGETYDPKILEVLLVCDRFLPSRKNPTYHGPRSAMLGDLVPDMVLIDDLVTKDGLMVMGAGTRLTAAQIQRIINFSKLNSVVEPIMVDVRF